MPHGTPAKLVFVCGFTERDAFEAHCRGYRSHVLVEVDDQLYPVFFYDPVRLQQELQASTAKGDPYVAEPGMIVVPEITLAAMQTAVEKVHKEGFFEHLRPVTETDLAESDPFIWPPKPRHSSTQP